jgi:hypothetical protein
MGWRHGVQWVSGGDAGESLGTRADASSNQKTTAIVFLGSQMTLGKGLCVRISQQAGVVLPIERDLYER